MRPSAYPYASIPSCVLHASCLQPLMHPSEPAACAGDHDQRPALDSDLQLVRVALVQREGPDGGQHPVERPLRDLGTAVGGCPHHPVRSAGRPLQ